MQTEMILNKYDILARFFLIKVHFKTVLFIIICHREGTFGRGGQPNESTAHTYSHTTTKRIIYIVYTF